MPEGEERTNCAVREEEEEEECVEHTDNKNKQPVAILSLCSSKTFTSVDRVVITLQISNSVMMQLSKVTHQHVYCIPSVWILDQVFVITEMLTKRFK